MDSGLQFPKLEETGSETPQDGSKENAPDVWWPRTIVLPIYPHLVMAGNGCIYHRLTPELINPEFPGLIMNVSMIYLWLLPHTKVPPRLASTYVSTKKRPRNAPIPSKIPPPCRVLIPSDEFWYEESEDETSDFSPKPTNPRGTEVIEELHYNENSIHRWIPQQPSPPISPPQTPRLTRYKDEISFTPTNEDWKAWDQTWRNAVMQPMRDQQ